MHVVYVIDNLGSGGAQRQSVALALQLRQEPGVRVSFVIYRESGFYVERLREAGISVVLLPKRAQIDPSLPFRMRQLFLSDPADLVHAFLPMPCLWSFLAVRTLAVARRPVFVAAERSVFDGFSWPHDPARRLVYPRADAVTVNAQCMVDEVRARLRVDRRRLHYIPNGIDLCAWDDEAAGDAPWVLEPGCLHLALVGGLRREKNHLLVLEALGRLDWDRIRRWRVWFVGAETGGRGYAEDVRKSVQTLGLTAIVRIVPPVQQIGAFMRRLDGVILPSVFEGFPNVVLEAMASRVPVLASAVGDVPNLVEDGRTGFVLRRNDVSSLACGLSRLADLSEEERRGMGEAGRETVERRFEISAVAETNLRLYRSLLDERGTAGSRGL